MKTVSVVLSIVLIALLVMFCIRQVKGLISVIKKRKQTKSLNKNNDNKGGV